MSNHYGVTSTGRVPGPVIEQLREQLAIATKANADLEAENARVKLELDETQAANAAMREALERLTRLRNDADADGGRLLVRAERAEHDRDAARRELVAM